MQLVTRVTFLSFFIHFEMLISREIRVDHHNFRQFHCVAVW